MNILKELMFRFSKEYCFDRMIKDGNVTKNKRCGGLMGGDKHTNYLSYRCVDCKYCDEELFR